MTSAVAENCNMMLQLVLPPAFYDLNGKPIELLSLAHLETLNIRNNKINKDFLSLVKCKLQNVDIQH